MMIIEQHWCIWANHFVMCIACFVYIIFSGPPANHMAQVGERLNIVLKRIGKITSYRSGINLFRFIDQI